MKNLSQQKSKVPNNDKKFDSPKKNQENIQQAKTGKEKNEYFTESKKNLDYSKPDEIIDSKSLIIDNNQKGKSNSTMKLISSKIQNNFKKIYKI